VEVKLDIFSKAYGCLQSALESGIVPHLSLLDVSAGGQLVRVPLHERIKTQLECSAKVRLFYVT